MVSSSPSPGRTSSWLPRYRASLVHLAREGRLSRNFQGTYVEVGLSLVDESVLALVDLAIARRSNITFVYPAPAGEVSVLLAAQILITRLLQGRNSPSVGVVTADATTVTRTWKELNFGHAGERAGIAEVFPCTRAGPNGEYPYRRRDFKGLLVGRQFVNWPVEVVIRDNLAGPVPGRPTVPTITICADPLDPSLNEAHGHDEPIWGWGVLDAALIGPTGPNSMGQRSPFSVAADRLATIASGTHRTIRVARNSEAEHWAAALKDDLMTLSQVAGTSPPAQFQRGLRFAWHHQRMLQALPVRPSQFDRFSGMPPIASRSTATYEPELRAWARALGGEVGELAEIIAGDLADLRNALENKPPFITELSQVAAEDDETLVVVSNTTAARALVDELSGDVQHSSVGHCQVVPIRRLHKTGTWARAFAVGMPPKWDWHRLDSGLTRDLHLLVLGDREAASSCRSLKLLHDSRERWSSPTMRRYAWERIVGAPPPPYPPLSSQAFRLPELVGATEFVPAPDPFEAFEPLLVSTPLFGDEGPRERLAEEGEDGRWLVEVEAVEVDTDSGSICLPLNRFVDVRVDNRLEEVRADRLAPGMFLIANRSAGRLGLLDAVAEQLRTHRPDLYAANLVIRDLRASVHESFLRSGMSKTGLYERLVVLGFAKTYQTARGYVELEGPMAPRDFLDLKRLNSVLDLGHEDQRLRQVFGAVQRERAFRRATGKALATAARNTVLQPDADLVNKDTGLSVADLQELVLEAKILQVRRCEYPVPLSETGVLLAA